MQAEGCAYLCGGYPVWLGGRLYVTHHVTTSCSSSGV